MSGACEWENAAAAAVAALCTTFALTIDNFYPTSFLAWMKNRNPLLVIVRSLIRSDVYAGIDDICNESSRIANVRIFKWYTTIAFVTVWFWTKMQRPFLYWIVRCDFRILFFKLNFCCCICHPSVRLTWVWLVGKDIFFLSKIKFSSIL